MTKIKNNSTIKERNGRDMQIITLTSDLGLKDHYVASIKAFILQNSPKSTTIDISHLITPFDVIQAGHVLRYCFEDFPEGTIHVVSINDEPEVNAPEDQQVLPGILKYKDHWFISNDNGFFGALLNGEEHQGFYRISDVLSNPKNITSPTKKMLLPAACSLANGDKIDEIAYPYEQFRNAFVKWPMTEENLILGHIAHIDHYGNLITNVSRSLFAEVGKSQDFTIYIRNKNYHINEISETYNAVPSGQIVAIFNNNNFLEIAINKGANATLGGAEKLLGMKIDDYVRIQFTSRGSHTTIDSLF